MSDSKLDSPFDSKASIHRVHQVLREHFRRAGRGSIQRVERELGIAEGSFRKWRHVQRLDLRMLHQALKALGVDPQRFWIEVFGVDFNPVEVARRPSGPPKDPVVRQSLARWIATDLGPSRRLSEDQLRQLDLLRDEDPRQGVRKSRSALKRSDRQQIPRLLAIYGAARRVEARLDLAIEALQHALDLSERGDADPSLCADIHRRLGIAYGHAGNPALGLLFAREAAQRYRLAGDTANEGRTLVDQGTRYFHLDRVQESASAFRAALKLLPQDSVRHRYAALLGLAVIHHRQGSTQEAFSYAEKAQLLSPKLGPALTAALLTLKAEILTARGDYEQAERCYSAGLEIHRSLSPLDAALAAVDLVRTQFLGGRINSALETIKGMTAFLEPLKGNQIACQALLELVRLALAGRTITSQVLDQVTKTLKKSRTQRERRAHNEI